MGKLRKSFVAALVVLAVMGLAACANDNPPQPAQNGETHPPAGEGGGSAPTQETSAPMPEEVDALAVLAEGAVDGAFIPLEPVMYTEEYEGYSCSAVVSTWVGQSNSKGRVFHPYDSSLVIFPYKSTETVIPFAIEVEATTPNADFPTDIAATITCFKQFASGSGGSGQTFLCTSKDVEGRMAEIQQRVESLKRNDNYTPEMIDRDISNSLWHSNGSHRVMLKESVLGEKNYMLGYYVIDDYFSPAHPQGNPDLFGPEGVTLHLSLQLGSASNLDAVTHYIALRPSEAYQPPATYRETRQNTDYVVPGQISG